MFKSVLSTILILLTSYAWSQSDTIIVFHPEEMACWGTCDKENTAKTRRQCTENNLFDYIKSHINQAALKGLNNNTEYYSATQIRCLFSGNCLRESANRLP